MGSLRQTAISALGGFRFLLPVLMLLAGAMPAAAQDAVDRLGIAGPIAFDGTDYALAWTSNPSLTYFKQEYLPAGQMPQTYKSMVLVEVLTEGADVKQALASQVQTLNDRKASDPLLNLSVLQNAQEDEVILDFLMSQKDEKGDYIVEWNAYRYVPYEKAGVLLFGISHRVYGNEAAKEFLGGLKELRKEQISRIAQQELPQPKPAK